MLLVSVIFQIANFFSTNSVTKFAGKQILALTRVNFIRLTKQSKFSGSWLIEIFYLFYMLDLTTPGTGRFDQSCFYSP